MTDCPACGYHDPFHTSWFDHEKDVAEPLYFKEWAPDIWESLQQASWILSEDGRILWHLTKGGTVERWKVDVVMARKGSKVEFDVKASQRKNYHLKGKSWYKSTTGKRVML